MTPSDTQPAESGRPPREEQCNTDEERKKFFQELDKERDQRKKQRISKCFMTGKACAQRTEDNGSNDITRETLGKDTYHGFLIVPFQPNLEAFHELDLKRYIKYNYGREAESGRDRIKIERADGIPSNGYIVCKRICQRIQDADFVIADISVDNPNVLYELGLAYGMRQKLLVVYQSGTQFGEETGKCLVAGGCKPYRYTDLQPIDTDRFPLSTYFWKCASEAQPGDSPRPDSGERKVSKEPPIMVILDTECADELNTSGSRTPKDIVLNSTKQIRGAIGVSIDEILDGLKGSPIHCNYKGEIENLRTAQLIERDARFAVVENQLRTAYCALIKIGRNCEPMSYFWVGFCHAIGKNVIPILIKNTVSQVRDPAFDTQPLWHITFWKKAPLAFQKELQDALNDMIKCDFIKWSRTRFWNRLCVKGRKVPILAGMVTDDKRGRQVVGAWDLMSISKLTEYLESNGLDVEIMSPQADRKSADIEKKLRERATCIIVGSPLSNPATDFVLANQYGLNETSPPSEDRTLAREEALSIARGHPKAVIAFKEVGTSDSVPTSLRTYRFRPVEGTKRHRGFASTILRDGVKEAEILLPQTESDTAHAHLLITRNVYNAKKEGYLVVLNGISGEATYALTQLLTEPRFERIVEKILTDSLNADSMGRDGVQYVYDVGVKIEQKEIAETRVIFTEEQAKSADSSPSVFLGPSTRRARQP